jgi:hypothetical protein
MTTASEVSSEKEPIRRARSDDGDTTDSENDSIKNDGDRNDGSDDDINNQFSNDGFD